MTSENATHYHPAPLRLSLGLGAGLALAASALLLATACADADQQELFEETQVALGANVGDACDVEGVSMPNETVVETSHPSCGRGQCVWSHPEIEPGTTGVPGYCTCRCDGPEDTGPFCACPESFTCVSLVEELGLEEEQARDLVGSYCLPE